MDFQAGTGFFLAGIQLSLPTTTAKDRSSTSSGERATDRSGAKHPHSHFLKTL